MVLILTFCLPAPPMTSSSWATGFFLVNQWMRHLQLWYFHVFLSHTLKYFCMSAGSSKWEWNLEMFDLLLINYFTKLLLAFYKSVYWTSEYIYQAWSALLYSSCPLLKCGWETILPLSKKRRPTNPHTQRIKFHKFLKLSLLEWHAWSCCLCSQADHLSLLSIAYISWGNTSSCTLVGERRVELVTMSRGIGVGEG